MPSAFPTSTGVPTRDSEEPTTLEPITRRPTVKPTPAPTRRCPPNEVVGPDGRCVIPPVCTFDRWLDPISLRCICLDDILWARLHPFVHVNRSAVCDPLNWCFGRRCRRLLRGVRMSRCRWDRCCWTCPHDCYDGDHYDDEPEDDHDRDHDRHKRVHFSQERIAITPESTENYKPFSEACPYSWPLSGGGAIDRTNVARCLSFIPSDPAYPNRSCSLDCKDDPCENSFTCSDCLQDSRCRWNRFMFFNSTSAQMVPYSVCELYGPNNPPQTCPQNDVNPLPNVLGIPNELILPRVLQACVSDCAIQANLDASPLHRQVLRANDFYLDSLVYIDSVGVPDQMDVKGIIDCVALCVNIQVWPNNLVKSGSVDVTPVQAVKKRAGQVSVQTTVLQISTVKGPEKPKDNGVDGGAIAGIAIGSVVAVLLFASVIGVAVYKTFFNRPPYCEQHDMYHQCQ